MTKRRVKRSYYARLLDRSLSSKNLWRNVNEGLGRKRRNDKVLALCDDNGDTTADPSLVSEMPIRTLVR